VILDRDGYRYYYNPFTFESGVEHIPANPTYLLSAKPVFIGPMPIRKDVKVRYVDLEIPRFAVISRIVRRFADE
jgi:hypothetical protein